MKTENITRLTQFVVTVPNLPGKLASITDMLSRNSIDISNLATIPSGNYTLVTFTTPAPLRNVTPLFEDFSYHTETVYSVVLPNKAGALTRLLKAISSADFNLNSVYATTILGAANAGVVIIPTAGINHKEFVAVLEKQLSRVAVA